MGEFLAPKPALDPEDHLFGAKGQQRWESSGFRIQGPKEDRMWRRLGNGEEPPGGSRRGRGSWGISSLTPAKDAPRSHPPQAWRRPRTSLLLDANRTGVGGLGCAERDRSLVSKGSIDSTPTADALTLGQVALRGWGLEMKTHTNRCAGTKGGHWLKMYFLRRSSGPILTQRNSAYGRIGGRAVLDPAGRWSPGRAVGTQASRFSIYRFPQCHFPHQQGTLRVTK